MQKVLWGVRNLQRLHRPIGMRSSTPISLAAALLLLLPPPPLVLPPLLLLLMQ